MSTTPSESGILQTGGSGFHFVGKENNKKWHIKMLVSFGATFVCLLLATAAIELHLRQKDHFGWLNCDYHRKGPSTEPSAIVEPAEVATQPAVALRSKRSKPSDPCLECTETEQRGNIRVMCDASPCGIFRIWPTYWADAVRAVPEAFASLSYESCVSNSECGKALVRGYIKRHAGTAITTE